MPDGFLNAHRAEIEGRPIGAENRVGKLRGPGVTAPVLHHLEKKSEILNLYPNQNVIFERLETTKQFGLLSDYFVSWTGHSGRVMAKVTVWGRDGTPAHVVQQYVARLLKGLVPARQISIATD